MGAAHSYHLSATLARAGQNAVPARLIAAHHGAQARAEARDRRIRDEDLALAGRPRLHSGNTAPVGADEGGWR